MDERDEFRQEQAVSFREIVAPVLRHRRVVIAVTVVGTLTAAVLAWLAPPSYNATAKLLLAELRARVTVSPDANAKSTLAHADDADLNSHVALLKSRDLVRAVLAPYMADHASAAGADDEAEGWASELLHATLGAPGALYRYMHGIGDADPIDYWVDEVVENLSVAPISRSSLIEVSYTGRDPAWVAEFVNELLATHIDRYAAMRAEATAHKFYQDQGRILGERYDQARAALEAFDDQPGSGYAFADAETFGARLSELRLAHVEAETSLAQASARDSYLDGEMRRLTGRGPTAAEPFESESAQMLRTKIVELEVERIAVLSRFSATSGKVRDVDMQLAHLNALLTEERSHAGRGNFAPDSAYEAIRADLIAARADIAAATAVKESLSKQMVALVADLTRIDAASAEREALDNEALIAREAYLTYRRKEEAARFSSALDQSRIVNVQVAEAATPPSKPEPSSKQLALIIGAIMSLAAGLMAAYALDWTDPSVKGYAHAQRLSGLDVLAIVRA